MMNNAVQYWDRAKRLRAIAAEDPDPENQELLKATAADCERMATELEAVEKLTRAISRAS
jgi:hypothetical protein